LVTVIDIAGDVAVIAPSRAVVIENVVADVVPGVTTATASAIGNATILVGPKVAIVVHGVVVKRRTAVATHPYCWSVVLGVRLIIVDYVIVPMVIMTVTEVAPHADRIERVSEDVVVDLPSVHGSVRAAIRGSIDRDMPVIVVLDQVAGKDHILSALRIPRLLVIVVHMIATHGEVAEFGSRIPVAIALFLDSVADGFR